MAGPIGVTGPDGSVPAESFAAGLATLQHHSCFRSVVFVQEPGLQVGATFRPNSPAGVCHAEAGGLSVIVYGAPLEKTAGWRVTSAQDVAEQVLAGGIDTVASYDGSFLIVVVDRKRQCVQIVNDRIGSLPLVYASAAGRSAFAPEAKALFRLLDLRPRLDLDAAIAFVNCGYPIGARTHFEGVRLLAPASVLSLDLQTAAFTTRSYWQLRFEPRRRLSEADAAFGLFETMLDSQRAVLADRPRRVQLLLTGGYDSRILLGLSKRTGRPPDEALTWGVDETIPHSDAAVARQLAGLADVPFRFLRYDADTLPLHATDWCFVSELTSDNAGNFIVEPSFLSAEAGAADVVLIGDQMVGPGGLPLDDDDAASSITKVPRDGLLPAFRSVLAERNAPAAATSFRTQLRDLRQRFPGEDPKDVQDSYFFHLYVHRWLLAPSYFREPMVTARRPMLSNAVLDFTSTLPRWLRVDKRVLLSALRLALPGMMSVPPARAPGVVDWSYAMRADEGVRGFLLEHLAWERISATPLGALLDRRGLEALTHEFFSQPAAPSPRTPSRQGDALKWRRVLSTAPALGRMARRAEPLVKRVCGWSGGSRAQAVLWRLALLSSLQSIVQSGWFERPIIRYH